MNQRELYKYIDLHRSASAQLLHELDRDSHLKTTSPQMSSGLLQGKVLEIISLMLSPRCILEIGTFTGLATLCLAEGLPPDGKIITIDPDVETTKIAKSHFDRSPRSHQIQLINGDAKKIIPTLDTNFDLVFIDADKDAYPLYYDLVIDKMPIGGVILADNTLWYGKVWNEKMDRKTKILHDFNVMVANDNRVEDVILPIRDGIHIIRKMR